MSVNQLGWYIEAGPSGRQSIVERQQVPSDYRVPRYRATEEPIRKYLLSGGGEPHHLTHAIELLKSSVPIKKWERVNRALSVGAMERLQEIIAGIEQGEQRTVPSDNGVIVISGLDVSVRPQIVLFKQGTSELPEIGAVKLYLSKTKPLTREVALNISVVLQRYLEVYYPSATVSRQCCQLIDVFRGEVWTPPHHQKRRLVDVEAACREIFLLWGRSRVAA